MTINPVDMQVVLPQVGQVNRIQRTQENQQQMEQQILGQLIRQDMHQKNQIVKKMHETDHNRITKENDEKKKESKSRRHGGKEASKKDGRGGKAPAETVGHLLDIKI